MEMTMDTTKITQTGISAVVLGELCDLAERYCLTRLILFGSRARGDYKRTSDIDLAISGGDAVSFLLNVDDETHTLLKYDIVQLDGAVQAELLESIRDEGITIYEKT
jgi:predicted nucleotidyltransferase